MEIMNLYSAKSKEDGSVISANHLYDLSKKLGLSRGFISECIRGTRNSKKYVFTKEYCYETT